MADLLAQGTEWLNGQRHEHLTQTVTYHRGGDSVEIAATVGRTEFEQTDDFGVVHQIESRDYLCRTADLILDSVVVLPLAGDLIRETIGAQVFVYEVMAPGTEQPWRYSDRPQVSLRIHTKQIDVEDV